ncbi:acyltransferase [Pseudoxanthomonas helianthi]|uniref:Acyltransferase n=1 Tax=Pseudoxanthomonas helianthi TaxID=1453541 RepID=A0A940X4X5_9GAMM|nr:acyltransferase [Pseudoxanthomonas helianthi]MBP3985371.1 acyltransferase [Pseudoxanthomonas helianthi]
MSARHWADIGESTSALGIRFLCGVHRWLGRWPFRLCLYPVVTCHWLANATARHASREYLRRLRSRFGESMPAPNAWNSLRHFARFAETLLDKILALGGRYPLGKVATERDAMLAQIAAGQGGVIVTAHIGCLELCQALAEDVPGFRVTALVHTVHAERFNRLARRMQPQGRVELMQVTELGPETAIRLAEKVARGEFVAVAGDRVPIRSTRNARAPFLGREAPFPIGPYVIAAILGCPLFAMSCLHRDDGYVVRFERFEERVVLPRTDRNAALARQAARFAQWLEAQVRQAPFDWFNFFPFWDQLAENPTHD